MTLDRVYVYGSGGHGKVVADILLAAGIYALTGFLDDRDARHGTQVLGLPVVGGIGFLETALAGSRVGIALGIGDNRARAAVAERCLAHGATLLTAIHPRASVARSATLSDGVVVMACAAINPDARVGRGAIVNTGAVVEHDVVVGDWSHVSPNSALGGASRLGAFSQLGTNACVLPSIRVGEGSIVGAGAVVVHDLPDHVVARGAPARVTRAASP